MRLPLASNLSPISSDSALATAQPEDGSDRHSREHQQPRQMFFNASSSALSSFVLTPSPSRTSGGRSCTAGCRWPTGALKRSDEGPGFWLVPWLALGRDLSCASPAPVIPSPNTTRAARAAL